jgi:anti-sigma regulatory factor (Ser/Thr protein kinase)
MFLPTRPHARPVMFVTPTAMTRSSKAAATDARVDRLSPQDPTGRVAVDVPGYVVMVPQSEVSSMSFQAGWSAAAPRMARQAMREWLADVPCSNAVVEDALVVVSELTTNALMHAGSAATVVASFDHGRLRVEVHDEDPMPPQLRAQPDASGGWGLRVVAALADGWGWLATSSGKQVWAEMLC